MDNITVVVTPLVTTVIDVDHNPSVSVAVVPNVISVAQFQSLDLSGTVVIDNSGIVSTVTVETVARNGIIFFETMALMFAAIGQIGDIANCLDNPDQHWKWSTNQNTWVPAF